MGIDKRRDPRYTLAMFTAGRSAAATTEGEPVMTFYRTLIAKLPEAAGVDPRHVEAYMRVEHRTLDGLTTAKFEKAAREAISDARYAGPDGSEALAQSYGL